MHADPSASANAIPDEGDGSAPALPTLAQIERSVIEYRLGLFEGNKSAVAASLGISRAMLYDRAEAVQGGSEERSALNAELELPEPPTRETAATMRTRICAHFPTETHAVLFEVRNATGHAQKRRTGYCDAMVMGLWPSRGLELWGLEIKVSRSDWLRELDRPEKCEEFFRYCHRWFVVAPANVVKHEELPPTWGLLVPSRDGLRAVIEAPAQQPLPADVGLLASICRSAVAGWQSHPAYIQAREQMQKDVDSLVESRTHSSRERLLSIVESVADFQLASGVTICDYKVLGDAVKDLPDGEPRRQKVLAAARESDRRMAWRGGERIGAAVRAVLDGGAESMREKLVDAIAALRRAADRGQESLAELDKRQGGANG